MWNSSIWPIDSSLSGAITLSRKLDSKTMKGYSTFPKSPVLLESIRLFRVISGHLLWREVLPLCRDTIGLFYSSSQLSMECWSVSTHAVKIWMRIEVMRLQNNINFSETQYTSNDNSIFRSFDLVLSPVWWEAEKNIHYTSNKNFLYILVVVVAIEKGAFWLLSTMIANFIYIYIYIYIYTHTFIYIIIILCHWHGFLWLSSLAIRLYHPLLLAGLLGYILCSHRAAVDKF